MIQRGFLLLVNTSLLRMVLVGAYFAYIGYSSTYNEEKGALNEFIHKLADKSLNAAVPPELNAPTIPSSSMTHLSRKIHRCGSSYCNLNIYVNHNALWW